MKTKNLIIILVLSLTIAYCEKSPTESETKPFLKTLWTLKSFDTSGEIIKSPEDQVFSIKFLEDGTFSGKSDCNSITGHFTVDSDNSLSIDSLFATEVYCGLASLDEKYYEALHAIKSYQIDNDRLYIYYNDIAKLNFQAKQ